MESAILGVILDSSVVIEAERQQLNVAQFLKQIVQKLGEREAVLSSITVAELMHGIYRANTEERRTRRRAFLDDLQPYRSTRSRIIPPSWLARSAGSRRPRA